MGGGAHCAARFVNQTNAMNEKHWALKGCDLLARLSPEELRRVESRSRIRKFGKQAPVYLPADEADGVLLLAEGRAKLCSLSSDGKQSILTFIEPGEIFGELALFDESPAREEYCETVEPSSVVLIPAEEMRRLLDDHPHVALGVTKLIGLRRRRIERRLKYLLFHSNRERVIHLLLELAEQYGRRTSDGVLLGIRLSHQDLANIVGSTRETVTVILGELQSEGSVALGRRKIWLTRMDQLAESVGAPFPQLPDGKRPGRTKLPLSSAAAKRSP